MNRHGFVAQGRAGFGGGLRRFITAGEKTAGSHKPSVTLRYTR